MSTQPLDGRFLMRGDDGRLYHLSLDGVEPTPVDDKDPDATLIGEVETAFEEVKKILPDACVFIVQHPSHPRSD